MYNQQRKQERQIWCVCLCGTRIHTPKLEAAKRSEADTLVEAVVWAQKALILASRVLITAGTPGHMYLDDRQAKCLERRAQSKLVKNLGSRPLLLPISSHLETHYTVTEKRFCQGVLCEELCLYLVSHVSSLGSFFSPPNDPYQEQPFHLPMSQLACLG